MLQYPALHLHPLLMYEVKLSADVCGVFRTVWCAVSHPPAPPATGLSSYVFETSFCCLQDFLVPDQAPKAARELLAGLLCSPPPHDVAAATHQALRGMREFITRSCIKTQFIKNAVFVQQRPPLRAELL
jgi:hypothetical protein